MIVGLVHGKGFDFSVADVILTPVSPSLNLTYESGLGGTPLGSQVQIGGSTTSSVGTVTPSYSGKNIRITYDGYVVQDASHTDALFSFGLISSRGGSLLSATTVINSPGAGAIVFSDGIGTPIFGVFSVHVPEYQVIPGSIISFAVLAKSRFLQADGTASSFDSVLDIDDTAFFGMQFSVSAGVSGAPTVTVRTRRFMMEFLD